MSADVNFLALVVGPPGYGKTSLAAHLAEERLRAGRVVLVQDARREYSPICEHYPDAAAYKRALADATAEAPAPRGAAFPTSADAVLELGTELGNAWNASAGSIRQPITLVINEASSLEASGPSWIDKLTDRCINQRRHLGLELVFCLQRPSQLTAAFWDAATEVGIFRTVRADEVSRLEKRLGVPDGAAADLPTLPRHRYKHRDLSA